MPVIKELITVGNSRMVIIPAKWLRYHEEEIGEPIKQLLMELNGEITLRVREKRRRKKVA